MEEEKPDEIVPYETQFPRPPTYEKADEIQEFDASGQLVTTLTVMRGSLVEDHGYSYKDPSLLSDDFLAKFPESRVDISIPTRSHSWLKSFMEVFLPAGYPSSVTEDYMEYQIYDSLQAFSSSIAGLIASRAVLEGVGVGDATASPTTALLLSVLQDSTGRIATILFAARLGLSLEPECKRWRLVADILNDAAMIFDCLSPALPKPLRVSLLSASAALRALCGVAAGSAKASLSAHFAKSGNLGELNAKDSSQETIISLLGMLAGTALIPFLTTPLQTWTALLFLLAIHLSTNHRAVRAVSMRTLNRQRASLLLRPLLSPPIRPGPIPALPSNPIATPLQISQRETVIHLDPSSLHDPNPAHASFVSLATILAQGARAPGGGINPHIFLRIFAAESYILYFDRRARHVFIALKSDATPSTALKAWFCAMECAHMDDEAWAGGWVGMRSFSDGEINYVGKLDSDAAALYGCVVRVSKVWKEIEEALKREGWDVDVNALETRASLRFSVVGGRVSKRWTKWGKEERKLRKESGEKGEEGDKVKEDGEVEPSSPIQYITLGPPTESETSSPKQLLSFGTTHSEISSSFQSPTRETDHKTSSEASTTDLKAPEEGTTRTSRGKLRLRKWLGRSTQGKDTTSVSKEGATEEGDGHSGKEL